MWIDVTLHNKILWCLHKLLRELKQCVVYGCVWVGGEVRGKLLRSHKRDFFAFTSINKPERFEILQGKLIINAMIIL